jgi:Helix-turn-helix domain
MMAAEKKSVNTAMSEYMTKEDLAKLVNRNDRTIRRWRALRIGPSYVQVERVVLYRKEAVDAWLRKHEKK